MEMQTAWTSDLDKHNRAYDALKKKHLHKSLYKALKANIPHPKRCHNSRLSPFTEHDKD